MTGNPNRADFMLETALALGDVVRLPVPGKHVLLVTHPRDVRRVMVTNSGNYKKSYDYKVLSRLIGDGLITSEGEVWQRDRRLQQPLFHGKALEQFFSTIAACTDAMVSRWKAGEQLRFDAEATRYALHVIGERLLSLDIREWSEEISHHFDICQHQIVARATSLVDLARVLPTPGESRFRKSLAELRRIVEHLLELRSRSREDRLDMFSVLSESGQSRERLRDQFLTMAMAGHETSAVALAWTYLCLSEDSAVDEAVAREASEALARPMTLDTLERLPLATQAIQESLRLFPPVAIMGREALEDDELGGFRFKGGTVIALSPYATHRRPDFWERPEAFEPARFSPERSSAREPGTYVPFALGPRGCIGQHLALQELQVAVARISSRFRLRNETSGKVIPIPMVSMRPDRPILMRLEARRF